MDTRHDYSDFSTTPQIGDNAMARLAGLAREQKLAEARVTELQRQLQEAQEELQKIAEKELPDIMQELRMKEFTTEDGIKIQIKESIHTSIPKARQDEAFEWLETHNQGGMIKREFKISFNRDEESWAKKFQADLAKRKKPVASKIERKVEPPTLKAYITRQLEAGVDIPQELFGLHRRKISTVEVK